MFNVPFCINAITSLPARAMHISGNVAYHKIASESIGPEKWAKKYPAGNAVDGNTDSRIYKNSCAHPDIARGQNAWWMVDLGETYRLSRVIIYNGDSSEYNIIYTYYNFITCLRY